ncbi:MAG: hypothetical protein JNL11_02150 [Bdellovibrionaceae bacterium]|nr:hypothetical protein [Pseudobdellovibrionaceae bacterium]
MEPKEWKLLLEFFKRLQRKAYQVRFENRTVTMAMRKYERPLMEHLDQLVRIADSEVKLNEKKLKASKVSWDYVVSILRTEKDFFNEFSKDDELRRTLRKFLKRGKYEIEIYKS